MSGDICNKCYEEYRGLAMDCKCTNYGQLDGNREITQDDIRRVVENLEDQEAQIQKFQESEEFLETTDGGIGRMATTRATLLIVINALRSELL